MGVTLFALSGALIATSSGVMALVMFALRRSRLHVLWGLFCVSVLVWGLGGYFIGSTSDPVRAGEWWRLAHVGVAFIPVLFFHFVTVFLKQTRRGLVAILYVLAFAFALLAIDSNLLIAHMSLVFGSFYYDSPPGLLYPLFTAYFFGLTIASHALLYRAYRAGATSPIDRVRIKYFFLGMLISFTGGSLCFLPVYGIDVYPITNFAVIMYPIIIGYAVLRHQLFDIRIATAQALTFLLWLFVGVRAAVSTTHLDLLYNLVLLAAVVVLGLFLVRSVSREIMARDRIEAQERALKLANSQLEAANRRQENLLHFLSHEVKSYFSKGASAFSSIASRDYGPVAPAVRRLANASLKEMRQGATTVTEILQAGDFKRGTISYDKRRFDLGRAVARIVNDFQTPAAQKRLSLRLEMPHALAPVFGDEAQLSKHVIANLLDNAIKYTLEGSVRVSLTEVEGKVLLAVCDTGVGITAEDQSRLFSEGGRGVHADAVNPHSTGYGLYIAKSVVEAHGGRIWATSDGSGRGSTFYVELPMAPPQKRAGRNARPQHQVADRTMLY